MLKIGSSLRLPGENYRCIELSMQLDLKVFLDQNESPLHFRKKDNNTYQGSTWQIKFKLDDLDQSSTYKLRVAIASATFSELQVYITSKLITEYFSKDFLTHKMIDLFRM